MKTLNSSLSWFFVIVYALSTAGTPPLPATGVSQAKLETPVSKEQWAAFPQDTGDCSFKESAFQIYLPLVQRSSETVSGQPAPSVSIQEDQTPDGPTSLPASASFVALIASGFAEQTAYLYKGANPIQSGVDESAIDPQRSAVLRGRACAGDSLPLAGVQIGIHKHPEYGTTLTRADGMFDLVVNGGELLTVSYLKSGYLPVQRQIAAPVQDFAWLPEVVLIPLDSQVTVIDLNAMLDPGGTYTSTIGPVTVREADGAHISIPGGEYLAPKILPIFERLGKEVRQSS